MLRDWGSWDEDFRALTADLRRRLLALLGGGADAYECVPMQGSGTFGVEAMLGTFLPRDGKVLVLSNGAYGARAAEITRYLGRQYSVIDKATTCHRAAMRSAPPSRPIRRSPMSWPSIARQVPGF